MKDARQTVYWRCHQFSRIFTAATACVVFWLALITPVRGDTTTDPTSLNRPGRYEVLLPGAGLTLGGIVFRPGTKSESSLPGIIVLHGWAQKGVRGDSRVEEAARRLSEQGYVALALSLRGWPPSGGRDDCGLEQPDDVAQAADWLRSVPGVSSERVGIVGFSLGGQVALLTAARSSRIKAVAAYYPVTDIQRWRETTSHSPIRDYYIPQVCGRAPTQSPVNAASKIMVPVLLIHGDRDTRVPTEQSMKMQEALLKAKRDVELVLVPGAAHGFTLSQMEQTWPSLLEFLNTRLRAK
jgi:dipeptidyl aminopeptidase/acylaminoacyl peptidase